MSASVPLHSVLGDAERVEALWLALRNAHLELTPEQLSAALRVHLHVSLTGSQDPVRLLRGMLAGVFVKDPDQEELYTRAFDRIFVGPLEPDLRAERPVVEPSLRRARRFERNSYWLGLGGIGTVAIFVAWLVLPPATTAILELSAAPAIPESTSSETAPEPQPNREELTLPVKWDSPDISVKREEIYLPAWYDLAEKFLISLPLLIMATLVLQWWLRSQLWLNEQHIDLKRSLDRFSLPDADINIWQDKDVRAKVRQLRRREPDPTDDLDVDRTAIATADKAGLFQPVLQYRRGSRENVLLVEQMSAFDHLTHLVVQAAYQLRRDHILISLYSFAGKIDALFAEDGRMIRIDDLMDQSRSDRLILVGTGAKLVDPLEEALSPQDSARLGEWRYRYFLSTKALMDWGSHELALFRSGFSIGTATPRGLIALARATESMAEAPTFLDVHLARPHTRQRTRQERTEAFGGDDRPSRRSLSASRGNPHLGDVLLSGCMLGGKYEVVRLLGRGGFGATYSAWDTNLRVRIAIKEFLPRQLVARVSGETLVRPYTGSEEAFDIGLEQFLSEARNLTQFRDHPGIISVLDFFPENGTGYMVMEYLAGSTLEQYIATKGPLDYKIALRLLAPVADALRACHAVGVIHRDISPGNIFLTSDDRVKVLDFGAARFATDPMNTNLSIILKEGYAPFEQYQRYGRQGPWTDIYALSATLYRLLTGDLPITSPDRLAGTPLPTPSEKGVKIPTSLQRLLDKGMAIQPEQRYQSVDAFLSDLQAVLGTSDPSRPSTRPTSATSGVVPNGPRRKRSRPRYVAIGLMAPVILVGCGLLFAFVIWPAYNSRQQAEVPLAVSQAAESTKDTVNLNSRGANIRKELTSHGDIVDIAVEPKDIWVLAAKPIPNGTHRNGDGSLFPDSDIFIIHVTSEAVTANKFTALPFQKREQENDLLPDAIIYRDGDYVYCFVNSLVSEHGYKMHGQIYEFDPSNLEVKSSDELFDRENWGWFPQFIKQEGLIKHWSSGPGYNWVLGRTVLKDVQIPRSVAALEFKNYQVTKSEGILPAAPSDVINKIVDLAVRGFKRR